MRSFDIHGLTLGLECDDPALEDAIGGRLRPFVTSTRPDHEIGFNYEVVADADAHTVVPPVGRSRPVYDPPAGEVLFFPDTDTLYIDYEDRVRVDCDCSTGQVRASIVYAERPNLWLLSRPLFTLPLMEQLKRRGLYSVHAAGVALDGRAALFAGGTGAGKSTLALAHAREGFRILADDLVLLRSESTGVEALAFPDELDVTPETATWFPELEHLADSGLPEGWRKHRVPPEFYGPTERAATPLVLVFPAFRSDRSSTLEPVARDEALTELVPNMLLTDPPSSQRHLDALAALVQQADCYRLVTGRDLERVTQLVRDLL